MKFCLLISTLCCLIYFSNGLSLSNSREWKSFKADNGKIYNNADEEQTRFKTFLKNKKVIEEHNKKYRQGKVSYQMAINKFTDMELSELNSLYTGLKIEKEDGKLNRRVVYKPTKPIADEKDWRQEGAVTGVKNQGQCGSCYAFSVTGVIEGQHFLKTKTLLELSEQQIVDCSRNYNNNGCGGGFMHRTYDYIKDAGGIDDEATYPYAFIDNEPCVFDPSQEVANLQSYDRINESEDDLLNAVATIGPISVGVMVQNSFYNYGGGVYNDPTCTRDGINHAVLLVGYGNEDGQDFWLVKNSWDTTWGEDGYIKMARNLNNQCGIASYATVPTGVSENKKNVVASSTTSGSAFNLFLKLAMSKSSSA